ncbi:hypothetical protein D3C71_1610170 [compost metagenome]
MSIAKIRNSVEDHVAGFDLGVGHENVGVFISDFGERFGALFLGELEKIKDLVLDLTGALYASTHYFFLDSMVSKRAPIAVITSTAAPNRAAQAATMQKNNTARICFQKK